MPAGLIESTVQKLDGKWLAETVAPAALFWFGGLGLTVWRHGTDAAMRMWIALPAAEQAGLAAAGVATVLLSAMVVEAFELFVIRMLEGHWPAWLGPVRQMAVRRQTRKHECMMDRFQKLNLRAEFALDATEQTELSTLVARLHNMPARAELFMPTALGNVLRSAESRPKDKYGLDTIVCWPRLWLLLPETAREDLGDSRSMMDAAAGWVAWTALFAVWSVIWPWAAVAAALGVMLSYLHLVRTAALYGTLLEAAFDVYRRMLYDALCWPLPADPQEEPEIGARLTSYLWRGSHQASVRFSERNPN